MNQVKVTIAIGSLRGRAGRVIVSLHPCGGIAEQGGRYTRQDDGSFCRVVDRDFEARGLFEEL